MNDKPLLKTRYTVGTLWDALRGGYERIVLAGVLDVAERSGVNIIDFEGGRLEAKVGYEAKRNILFDLVGPQTFDGLIVLSAALADAVGPKIIQPFCERYQPLPVVSIALSVDGIPSVLVDNDQGMRDLITHLIEAHGRRRIAFICGTPDAYDAERRYQIYGDVLAAHGLPLDPTLVTPGDFFRQSGTAAIKLLLDERGASFDAIVGANDNMAIGAIEELRARGVNVPQQVAVVGFDDIESSRLLTPPLTTVRQPLYEQGQQALELVLAQLRGEPVPAEVVLPTRVVIRQSCGCFSATARRASVELSVPARPAGEPERVTAERVRAVAHAVGASSDADPRWHWAERLVKAFAAEGGGEQKGEFLAALSQMLEAVSGSSEAVMRWQDGLSVLRGLSLAEGVTSSAIESVWHAARVLVAEAAQRRDADQRQQLEQRTHALNHVVIPKLMAAGDREELAQAVAASLGQLDIGRCYLALYEDGQTPTGWARWLLDYEHGRSMDLEIERFQAAALVPNRVRGSAERYELVVEPLFYREQQLGYALFELEPGEGLLYPGEALIYDQLREQISSALKGMLLVQELKDYEVKREQLLSDLAERARQLKQAYAELKDNHARLLIAEKMASLGRLTSGIAQEMNAPLVEIRSTLVELARLTDQAAHGNGQAGRAPGEETLHVLSELKETNGVARRALERLAGFVSGIKTQTQISESDQLQSFSLVQVIEDVLLLREHAAREAQCSLNFRVEGSPLPVWGSPARFRQVVNNLLMNAIEASAPKGGGPITVRLQVQPTGGVVLEVSDRGVGIAPAHQAKIFDPMFTSKPFGQRTGLGLTIVRDIVGGELGGTIEMASQLDQGTTFTLHLPHFKR